MKDAPKKQQRHVGGGTVYEPWCPPPGDLGYPQMPGCPSPTQPYPLPPEFNDPTII